MRRGSSSRPSEADPKASSVPVSHAVGAPLTVIDVGSNTVRLVVFDELRRAPHRLINEKVSCRLGRDIGSTGRLYRPAVDKAIAAVVRFVERARGIGASSPQIVATAAVRDAADGPDFVAAMEERVGHPVAVVDGDREATLCAEGLLFGIPGADGLVADLGGGSLELVRLRRGAIAESATLPLGSLRLAGVAPSDLRPRINAVLDTVPWLTACGDCVLYAIGGGLRSLARSHMEETGYPLRIVDRYTMSVADMSAMLRLVGDKVAEPKRLAGVPKDRRAAVPLVAAVVEAILARFSPRAITFSAHGLREGLLYEQLPRHLRHRDPLLESCEKLARREAPRAAVDTDLFDWMAPLFSEEDEAARRLRHAACVVSEIGWSLHPMYRPAAAMSAVLYAPLVGIDHPGRAFLGQVLLARYGGGESDPAEDGARLLLAREGAQRAAVVGTALRLGWELIGGAAGPAAATRLVVDDRSLTLSLIDGARDLGGEAVEARLAELAARANRAPRLVVAA